jgi:hypothetical protein
MRSAPPPFVLPSVASEPILWDDALATVLGYARATRSLKIKTPSHPDGHVVQVRAFSYSVYDCVPASDDDEFAWLDVLVVDGLNGRLSQRSIVALKDAGERAWKYVHRAEVRAGGRAFWDLPIEEVIAPEPPGTTGEALAAAWAECMGTDDIDVALTHKLLHHRRPRLFPLIDRKTRFRLEGQVQPGAGRLWAVIHRELTRNAEQFTRLESALDELLTGTDDVRLERLRLHDILLWTDKTGQRDWAAAEGRDTEEWQTYVSRRG